MHDVLAFTQACAVVWLPGISLLLALAVRRPLWLVAVSPAASVGVASLTATACALPGLPFGAGPLGVATAVLLAVGVVRVLRDRRSGAIDVPGPRSWVVWAPGLLLAAGAVGLSLVTWRSGMGALTTVGQEHDMIGHTVLTAYIERTGNGAPWQLLPVDLLSGGTVTFFPSGLHLLMAATADLTGSTVVGMNAVTVLVLGPGWAASAAALGYVAARRARLDQARAMVAAGIAAVVAVGLYRPVFSLVHEGGILANAATLVLAPGLLAALLTVRRGVAATVAAGTACAGLVAVHPSAIVTVGVSLVAWWIGEACTRMGRRRFTRQLPALLVTGVVAAVVALPVLWQLLGTAGGVTGFPPDVTPTPFGTAVRNTVGMVYGGWIPQNVGDPQLAAAVLTALGVVAALVTRRAFGLVAAWLVWSAIVVAAWVEPGTGPQAAVTGFFYHAQLRVWSHVSLLAPALAGLGAVLVASAAVLWLTRRNAGVRRRSRPAVLVLACVLGFGYLLWPGVGYARIEATYLANRYSRPDFTRVGADDRKAIEWLASRHRPGERVLNSANDGSTFLYVDKGIPIVNRTTLGEAKAPYTYRLLAGFNRYPTDPEIRRVLRELNVRWVYVDAVAPTIAAGSSPDNWVNGRQFATAPGLTGLDALPGLRLDFRSGTVSVYELDRSAVTAR